MTLFHKKPDVYDIIKVPTKTIDDNPYDFEERPEWVHRAIRNGSIAAVIKDDVVYRYQVAVQYLPVAYQTAYPDQFILRDPQGRLSIIDKTDVEQFYQKAETE